MKRLLSVCFTALFFITVFYSNLLCQPKYYFNLTGGYSIPEGDFRGDLPDTLGTSSLIDFSKLSNYGFSGGWNINFGGKMRLDSAGNINLTAGFNYNSFSVTKDYPRTGGTLLSYKDKMNVITLAAGFEYMFSPAKKLTPFVGLEMTANFFSGTIKASGDTSYQQFRVNESRYGVLVNAGVDYKINKTFGVTGGIKYNFSNLIGKSFQSATTTGNTDTGPTGVNVDTDVPLNDGMNGSIKAKSIYYIQIYAGVSYYFAYPLKYKKQ